jgi:hypothetical protein
MKMIQGRKTNALAPCDIAVSALHMSDDSGVILHDVTVAVDNSATKFG